MADQLLYEVSNSVEQDGEPFTRRENVYIIDQNNGSYTNNTIIMDCASVSNAGKWADFKNATIVVPLILTMSSVFDFSVIASDFAVGLKNGFHQLISSINVEYNNSSVVQISNLTNMYISYKLNTTLSVDDVVTIGSQIGFFNDSAQSWEYDTLSGRSGQGSINNYNNIISMPVDEDFAGMSGNIGFFKRQLDVVFSAGQVGVDTLLGANWYNVAAVFAKSFTVKPPTPTNGYYGQAWYILATIRLKDMADFFAQMPLVRNAYVKLYINLNQSRTTIFCDGSDGALSLAPQNATVFGGNTSPIMIASGVVDNGFGALATAVVAATGTTDVAFTVSCSVLTSLDSNCPSSIAKNNMLSSCRLYIDLYTMNPMREEQYLMQRTKTIKYRDIFQYQFLNVQQSFNFLVSNGISGLKEIVIVPLISSTYNGSGSPVVQGTTFSTLVSPFCSEPATCSPLMWFNNLNFQISGVNIFANNEQYGYEMFQNELYGVGSINGGLTDGLTSGLISQTAFYQNYGYLVANVGRRLPEDDRTPKSVQIAGTCLTQVPVDLYVFCVFEKEITIDTYSGKRVA